MDIEKLFEGLTDPREAINQLYPFEYLMLIAICAAMAGIDSFVGIENFAVAHKECFDRYFGVNYIPRHDTFNHLFQVRQEVAYTTVLYQSCKNVNHF